MTFSKGKYVLTFLHEQLKLWKATIFPLLLSYFQASFKCICTQIILLLGGKFTRLSKAYPGWNKRNKGHFLSSYLFQGGKTLESLSFQFSSWTASISSLWYIQEMLMWQEWESNLKITGTTDTSTLAAFLSGKPGFFTWSPPAVLLPHRWYLLWSWNCSSHVTEIQVLLFCFPNLVTYPPNWIPDLQVPLE